MRDRVKMVREGKVKVQVGKGWKARRGGGIPKFCIQSKSQLFN